MFSFLILLPLTLISAAIAWLLITTPQVAAYVEYVSILGLRQEKQWLLLQIAAYFLSYAAMCFLLVATARTMSAPLPPDRPVILKRFQLLLEALFVALPSIVLIALSIRGLSADRSNWILWLGAGMAAVGFFATVGATWTECTLDFFRSSLRPFAITKVDLLGGLVLAAGVGLFVSVLINPVETASFLGIFPILFLTVANASLILAVISARRSSPIAILSIAFTTVVVLQALDSSRFTIREFRHSSVLTNSDDRLTVDEVWKRRENILRLEPAFRRWLEHRRPAIEAYRAKDKAYPVFVVAAQGGGVYAGYHAALSLARLYDECPEFAHHVFAISAVSGGSLGSAVFAELLRSLPAEAFRKPVTASSKVCTPTDAEQKLEEKVKAFFEANFLSPVIASMLVVDLPGLLAPQLRYIRRMDRAIALEYAFEGAWRKADYPRTETFGLDKEFYGRWQPEAIAPALFLTATDVGNGVPVLVSQINWPAPTPFLRIFRPNIANILRFRPDLQLATSTAVSLSARFPYVTPPANIGANRMIKIEYGPYKDIEVLELLDGGFVDNSGGRIARELRKSLERLLARQKEFKDFKSDLAFHLIQFTDRESRRLPTASNSGHFELVAPLVAFNNIRLARPVEIREDERDLHSIYLADGLFESSLNWMLAKDGKREIERRSGGKRDPGDEVCCLVGDVEMNEEEVVKHKAEHEKPIKRRFDLDEDGVFAYEVRYEKPEIKRFVPNEAAFRNLIELMEKGGDRVVEK